MYREKIDGQYFIFIFLFYAFLFIEVLDNYVSFLGMFDELVAMVAFPLFLISLYKSNMVEKKSLNFLPILLIVFIFLGFSGNLLYSYQPLKVAFQDILLNVKFWLALYVGLFWGRYFDQRKYARRIMFHVRLVTYLYFILTVINNISPIFNYDKRYGMQSTQLFYQHSTYFAANCMFLIVVLLSVSEYSFDFLTLLIQVLLMSSTLRAKAFAAAFVVIALCYIVMLKNKKLSIKSLMILAPLAFLIAWNKIYFYFFSSIKDDSARNMLSWTAMDIANDSFPFGAGHGTYACYLSGVNYSPIYEKYGISGVNGIRPDDYSFISDSFWPMVLGQNGWIGFITFIVMLIVLYINIQKIKEVSKTCYFSAIAGFIYLLIASMAESSFVHPMMLPLALWMGVQLSKVKDKVDKKEIKQSEAFRANEVYVFGRNNISNYKKGDL